MASNIENYQLLIDGELRPAENGILKGHFLSSLTTTPFSRPTVHGFKRDIFLTAYLGEHPSGLGEGNHVFLQ